MLVVPHQLTNAASAAAALHAATTSHMVLPLPATALPPPKVDLCVACNLARYTVSILCTAVSRAAAEQNCPKISRQSLRSSPPHRPHRYWQANSSFQIRQSRCVIIIVYVVGVSRGRQSHGSKIDNLFFIVGRHLFGRS